MRLIRLTIAVSAGISLLVGCSFQKLSADLSPPSSLLNSSTQESDAPSLTEANNLTAAQRLAWQAAVMVQHPPHSVSTWQQAKVKWRQAIRLLEDSPETTTSAQTQKKLVTYRLNYTAISDRLTTEQTAADQLKAAQTLAWQAAVTVQNPPHSLKVWRRASRKWQEAIALLEPIPNTTSVFNQSQARLTTYRSNYTAINQRMATETAALTALKQFSDIATRLNDLPTAALTSQGEEQVGITQEEYTDLVQTLQTAMAQFSKQPEARKHIIYPDLAAAIDDYQLTLKLWQAYLDYKQDNAQWLYGDVFNQLFPLSSAEVAMLTQDYGIRAYSGGTKVSLRFSAWAIWQQASQRVRKAQQKILSLN